MKLIYVVEDHEVIRNGVVQYLTLSGYESEGFKCIADASAGFAHRVFSYRRGEDVFLGCKL